MGGLGSVRVKCVRQRGKKVDKKVSLSGRRNNRQRKTNGTFHHLSMALSSFLSTETKTKIGKGKILFKQTTTTTTTTKETKNLPQLQTHREGTYQTSDFEEKTPSCTDSGAIQRTVCTGMCQGVCVHVYQYCVRVFSYTCTSMCACVVILSYRRKTGGVYLSKQPKSKNQHINSVVFLVLFLC